MSKNEYQKPMIITMILACGYFLLARYIPLALSIYYGFNNLITSPNGHELVWAGWDIFRLFFERTLFWDALISVVRHNLAVVLFTLPIAGILVYSLSRLKSYRLKILFTVIISITAVIPSVLIANFVKFHFTTVFIQNNFTWIYAVTQGYGLIGLIVIAWFLMFSKKTINRESNIRQTFFLIFLFVVIFLSRNASSDYDFMNTINDTSVYYLEDISRFSMALIGNTDFSLGSVLWIVKYVYELIFTIIGAFIVYLTLKTSGTYWNIGEDKKEYKDIAHIIILAIASVAVIASCIALIIPVTPGDAPIDLSSVSIKQQIIYFVFMLLVSIISVVISGLISYPFTSKKRTIKIIYTMLLIPSIFILLNVWQYFTIIQLGLASTTFAIVMVSFMPIWMIVGFIIMSNIPDSKKYNTLSGYCRAMVPTGLIMTGISFAAMWGGVRPAAYYAANIGLFNMGLWIKAVTVPHVEVQSLILHLGLVIPIILVWIVMWMFIIKAERNKD